MSRESMELPLGTVFIDDVFLYYDGPRLFTCHTHAGVRYVGYWVEEEEDCDRWLFVVVSFSRLRQLRLGTLSLRQTLLNAEDGVVFEIRTYFGETAEKSLRSIRCNSIDSNDLPSDRVHLTASELETKNSASVRAFDFDRPRHTAVHQQWASFTVSGKGSPRGQISADLSDDDQGGEDSWKSDLLSFAMQRNRAAESYQH